MCGTMIPTNAIKPADRDSRGRSDRRGADHEQANATHVHTECRRLLVAYRKDVEQTPVHDDHRPGNDRIRKDDQHVAPTRGREPAEEPCVDLLHCVDVLLLDERLQRGEERRDRDAREDERRRCAKAACRAAERVGRDHRDGRADEAAIGRRSFRRLPPGAYATASVAPRPAPAAAPRRYGSASGFRKTP